MTESQATLHQLQAEPNREPSDRLVEPEFIQTVELSAAKPLRKWLRLSAVLTFAVGFLLHQYYLHPSRLFEAPVILASAPVALARDDSAPMPAGIVERDRLPAKTAVTLPLTTAPALTIDDDKALLLAASEAAEKQAQQAQQLNLLKQKQLDLLYANATAALSKDRLTTPQSDNAVHYFKMMLELNSAEPRALSGLKLVAQRYKSFAITLARKGDISAAAEMLELAQSVAPQMIGLGELIAQMPAASGAQTSGADPSVSAKPATATQSTEWASVSRSDNGKLNDAKFLAKKSLAAGQPRDAVQLLISFMPQSATDGEFVELLHQAYLQANQTAEALNLRVTLQGALPSHYIAKMQAAEYLQSGRPVDAISVLEKSLPSYQQDSSYYGLLAGLYYRVQRYGDAEQAYEKLLAVAPETGSYWLGYAVALDAQSNRKALDAFKKAKLTLPAQDAARQYVEQRVKELGGS